MRFSIGLALLLVAFSVHTLASQEHVAAAETRVECGQISEYTAPDPDAPQPGSITLGLDGSFVISASASIAADAAAVLPTGIDGSPTCLALTLDTNGEVIALAFASTGQLCGLSTFDEGSGFYTVANRFSLPQEVLAQIPGLGPIAVASRSGNEVCVTFFIAPTGGVGAFTTETSLAGTVESEGEITVQGVALDAAGLALTAAGLAPNVQAALHAVSGRGEVATLELRGEGTSDPDTGDFDWALNFAVRTDLCSDVRAGTGEVFVRGERFRLSPASTVAPSLLSPGRHAIAISVDFDDVVSLETARIGCGGGGSATPTPTPTPSPSATATPTVGPSPVIVGMIPPVGSPFLLVGSEPRTPAAIVAALRASGCNAMSIAVTDGGRWVLYNATAPAWVNARFPAMLAAGAPFVARCV